MEDDRSREPERYTHLPVLFDETIEALAVQRRRSYIDATVGLGGHAEGMLRASAPDGRLLGIDADPDAVAQARQRVAPYSARAIIVRGNFRELRTIAMRNGFSAVDGILFDLGVSSLQFSEAGRGFSFQYSAPLDMRMDPELKQSAADIVNELDESELASLLRRYGQEPAAGRIARAIIRHRPIETTTDLAEAVTSVVPRRGARVHPATRTFQALRIAVNDELQALEDALAAALDLLQRGGRLAVITFHSLEDRIVKGFLQRESRDCICPPSLPVCVCSHRATLRLERRSAIKPAAGEIARNPRSRSAQLRFAERL
jgi:16S rRNA (cytosine1402-N4)-methyltransferase